MLIIKLFGVFWFSLASMFSTKSCESLNCDDSNVLEYQSQLNEKGLARNPNQLYLMAYSEFANVYVYNNMLTTLIDDASIESIDFVNSNNWYNGRYFYFKADLIGQRALTTSYTKHRFRYYDNSIYFFAWDGSDHAYDCWGYKISRYPYDFIDNTYIYSCEAYHFTYAGSSIATANIDLSYFNSNTKVNDLPNLGISFEHYIVPPGDPDYPNGQENHMFTTTRFLLDYVNNPTYEVGYADGFIAGQLTRNDVDYNAGYQAGLIDGALENPEISAIFTGILNVGLLPVNVFLEIFNFEIFGISISGLVSGLLTISIIIIIVRFLFGGKNDK